MGAWLVPEEEVAEVVVEPLEFPDEDTIVIALTPVLRLFDDEFWWSLFPLPPLDSPCPGGQSSCSLRQTGQVL